MQISKLKFAKGRVHRYNISAHGEIIISRVGKSIREMELLWYVALYADYHEHYNFRRVMRRFQSEFEISWAAGLRINGMYQYNLLQG